MFLTWFTYVLTEKDIVDNINSEKLSYHTTILKYENLWKKILKLYILEYVFILWC